MLQEATVIIQLHSRQKQKALWSLQIPLVPQFRLFIKVSLLASPAWTTTIYPQPRKTQRSNQRPLILLNFVLPFKNTFPYFEGCFGSQLCSGEEPFSVSWLSSRCNMPCAPQFIMLMRNWPKPTVFKPVWTSSLWGKEWHPFPAPLSPKGLRFSGCWNLCFFFYLPSPHKEKKQKKEKKGKKPHKDEDNEMRADL